MSNVSEKLQRLIDRISEVKETIDLKNLLEAMGFFALFELFEQLNLTLEAIQENLQAHIGGFIDIFQSLTHSYQRVTQRLLNAFTPRNSVSHK
jgi:hypothetical protein